MTALEAIRRRDAEALMDAFSSIEEALAFRIDVLPDQPADDCRWFWQQIMTPEQFEETFACMRDVVLGIATARGLVPHEVQGGFVDGVPVIHATARARDLIFHELPSERHSFLKALLIQFPS